MQFPHSSGVPNCCHGVSLISWSSRVLMEFPCFHEFSLFSWSSRAPMEVPCSHENSLFPLIFVPMKFLYVFREFPYCRGIPECLLNFRVPMEFPCSHVPVHFLSFYGVPLFLQSSRVPSTFHCSQELPFISHGCMAWAAVVTRHIVAMDKWRLPY